MANNPNQTTHSCTEFIQSSKINVTVVTLSLTSVTVSAEVVFHLARLIRGPNISDIGVSMYDNGGSALLFWAIGFPILSRTLIYIVKKRIIRKRITQSANLSSWVLGVIGFEFWIVYGLALGF